VGKKTKITKNVSAGPPRNSWGEKKMRVGKKTRGETEKGGHSKSRSLKRGRRCKSGPQRARESVRKSKERNPEGIWILHGLS